MEKPIFFLPEPIKSPVQALALLWQLILIGIC